jgi:hypothetical protein
MKWFVEFAKKSLKLPVFIWLPVSKDDLIDASISDPLFSAVIWTMIFSNMYSNNRKMFSINFGWFFQSIKKLFKKILP